MTDQLTDTGLVAGTWALDPAHTTVGFTARHLMSKVRGTFNEFEGRITTTTDPLESTIEVTIKASSISTNNEQRDAHLRSADFFDVETYPEITFRSTRVEQIDDEVYRVTGDLTIKDATQPVSVDFSLTGSARDPFGNVRVGFEGALALKRSDWALTWNTKLDTGGVLVSDRIQVEFDVSAIRTV